MTSDQPECDLPARLGKPAQRALAARGLVFADEERT